MIVSFDRMSMKKAIKNKGDYEKDGLWYCGNCNTPKQVKTFCLGKEHIWWCNCKCQDEASQKAREEEQRRERMQRIERLQSVGFTDKKLKAYTFENDDRSKPSLSNAAERYTMQFDEMKKEGRGLLLYGSVGTGKTFAACCIANRLINNCVPCLVTNFPRLINDLHGRYDGKQKYLDSLNRYDLLVIDDLHAERNTEYVMEVIFGVIDGRYRSGLPLIVTTNLTGEELKNPTDIRWQRINSRLFDMCIPILVDGEDRRTQGLKQRIESDRIRLGL